MESYQTKLFGENAWILQVGENNTLHMSIRHDEDVNLCRTTLNTRKKKSFILFAEKLAESGFQIEHDYLLKMFKITQDDKGVQYCPLTPKYLPHTHYGKLDLKSDLAKNIYLPKVLAGDFETFSFSTINVNINGLERIENVLHFNFFEEYNLIFKDLTYVEKIKFGIEEARLLWTAFPNINLPFEQRVITKILNMVHSGHRIGRAYLYVQISKMKELDICLGMYRFVKLTEKEKKEVPKTILLELAMSAHRLTKTKVNACAFDETIAVFE